MRDPVVFLVIAYGAFFGGIALYLRSLVSRQRALEKKIQQRSNDVSPPKELRSP